MRLKKVSELSNLTQNILAWLIVFAQVVGIGVFIALIAYGLIAGYEYSQLFDPHGYVDLIIEYAIEAFVVFALVVSGCFALWLMGLFFIEIKNDALEDLQNKKTGNYYE